MDHIHPPHYQDRDEEPSGQNISSPIDPNARSRKDFAAIRPVPPETFPETFPPADPSGYETNDRLVTLLYELVMSRDVGLDALTKIVHQDRDNAARGIVGFVLRNEAVAKTVSDLAKQITEAPPPLPRRIIK